MDTPMEVIALGLFILLTGGMALNRVYPSWWRVICAVAGVIAGLQLGLALLPDYSFSEWFFEQLFKDLSRQ